MCGIAGKVFFNSTPEKSDQIEFEKALMLQNHRGPDFTSSEIINNCILGHNRLSIIDLNARSNQPMMDSSLQFTICFNGEIYNYQDLKNELLKDGIKFKTSSDTEVILYHLIKHGTSGLKYLEGCFALAFHSKNDNSIFLARDTKGINPLLYSQNSEGVIFGSELQTINQLIKKKTIDHAALNQYFKYTYIPAPRTILQEVKKVLPGEIIVINDNIVTKQRINLESKPKHTNTEINSLKKELKTKLENAVMNRLQADVPLGTFLSGGLDSSIVSAIAANFKENLHTFSIGFSGNKHFDETPYSKIVAKHIGSIHHAIQLDQNNIAEDISKVINSFDEPFADSSAIAMYFLSKETKKNVTVALSGDGADELFGGYNKHRAFLSSQKSGAIDLIAKFAKNLPKGSRDGYLGNKIRQLKKYNSLKNVDNDLKYDLLATFTESEVRSNLLLNYEEPEEHISGGLNEFLLKDQSFILPNDMLKKVDLMSMQHGLEVRVPFLDQEVIDLANSIPENLKIHGKETKYILKETFKHLLPEEILNRNKKGFEVPLNQWMKDLWNEITKNKWFDKDYLETQNLFSSDAINSLKKELFSNSQGNSGTTIWAYIVFQNWYDKTFSL